MAQSLEELRAENAEPEEEVEQITEPVLNEALEDASEEEAEEAEEAAASDTGETEEPELEAWQLTEEQTSEDNESFSSSDIGKVRRKFKAKLTAEKDENAELRAQLEALTAQVNGTAQPAAPAQATVGARPTLESMDYDEDAYNKAMDDWYDAKVDARVSAATHTQVKTQAQTNAENAVAKSLDAHYDRASTLAQESNISAEVYQAADLKVREAFESVMPGQGDVVTNQVISSMGEGSEKVMYFLGRNPQARAKLTEILSSDPGGIKAALYLGKLQAEVGSPQKRKSNAPKPAKKLDTGDNSVDPGAALRKQYEKADTVQACMDIKFKARDAGINTKKW